MPVRSLLFPKKSRLLPGHRWLNIALRSLHLVGITGLGAGFLYSGQSEAWRIYLDITLASGVLLTLLAIWSNAIWLLQLRGQAILLKLLLLVFASYWSAAETPLFILVILISGIIAHAPGNVRYYSPIHRRRIENL